MSSRRTMVDRLDTGDGFTYALLSLIALGDDVRTVAEDPRPRLRVVTDEEASDDESDDEECFDQALLGLIALGDLVQQLIPAPPTADSATTDADIQSMRPRDLLR